MMKVFFLALLERVHACSTVVVGKLASVDGSVMAAHSNDGDGDVAGHIRRVLAQDWPSNATRHVSGGQIPQAAHTFAYHTEGYAIMNENSVGLAESTCSGRFGAKGGFLNIVDLGQLAMERANTSRNAVTIMGTLASTHGYHDAAESLIVIDPREAFIFQILPADNASSAIWAAQRVPDNHVGVVTNGFTIRDINFKNQQEFILSSNLREVAERNQLWNTSSGSSFDFTRIFASPSPAGKPNPDYGVGRRMWVAYSILTPEHKFPSSYRDLVADAPYPATASASPGSVNLSTVFSVMRNYYQGTPFDMTKGLAAGPFGSPDRWAPGPGESMVQGRWERTIAIHRSIVTYCLQARAWLPDALGGTVWFAPTAAHTSTYTPFACGQDALPQAYTNTSALPVSAYHTFRHLFNLAQLKFGDMVEDIASLRQGFENQSLALQAALSSDFGGSGGNARLSAEQMGSVSERYNSNAESMLQQMWAFRETLLQRYADGYCNGCGHGPRHMGYPAWWLKLVDYSGNSSVAVAQKSPQENVSNVGSAMEKVLSSRTPHQSFKGCLSTCKADIQSLVYNAACVDECAKTLLEGAP